MLLDLSVATAADTSSSPVGLLRALPRAPSVVVFAALADQRELRAARAAGAAGCVLKDATPAALVAALRQARKDDPPTREPLAGDDVGETELVRLAATGDPDVWERLYRRAYPGLLAFARRRLSPEEATEAVADTFLRALTRLDRFARKGGGFEPWLFGIARDVITGAHRAAPRRLRLVRADRRMPPARPLARPSPPPDGQPSATELATQRRAALDRRDLPRPTSRPLRTRVAIGASAALVLAGASTAAAATNRLPPPIQAAADALGLHREPTDLDRTTDALARLRDAVARGDVAGAERATAELRSRLGALAPEDRAKIAAEVDALLAPPPETPGPSPTPGEDGVGSASTGDDHLDPRSGRDGGGDDTPAPSSGGQNTAPSSDDHGGGGAPGPSGDDPGGGAGSSSASATVQSSGDTASSGDDGGGRDGGRGGSSSGSDAGSGGRDGSGHGG